VGIEVDQGFLKGPVGLGAGSTRTAPVSKSDPHTGQASDALLDDILGDLKEDATASRWLPTTIVMAQALSKSLPAADITDISWGSEGNTGDAYCIALCRMVLMIFIISHGPHHIAWSASYRMVRIISHGPHHIA
jgi:hypothetical protein